MLADTDLYALSVIKVSKGEKKNAGDMLKFIAEHIYEHEFCKNLHLRT